MGVAGGLVEAGGEGVGESVAFVLEGCEDLVGTLLFLIWNSVSIIYCSDPTMPT